MDIQIIVQIYELLTADGAWRGGEGARDGRQRGARTTSAGLQQQLGAVAGRRVCASRVSYRIPIEHPGKTSENRARPRAVRRGEQSGVDSMYACTPT